LIQSILPNPTYHGIHPGARQMFMIRYKTRFYSEDLSTPRPNPKLEDNPVSAVRYCLFNTFAAALDIGGRSSNRKLRTRLALMTETHLSRTDKHSHVYYTVCPTRYRTRLAGGPLLRVATIIRTTDTHYRHISFHFSHNERTPVQISLQYLHWC